MYHRQDFGEANKITSDSNQQFIIDFREDLLKNLEKTEYGNSLNKLNENIEYFFKQPILYSFLVLANFRSLTGIQWLVGLENNITTR